MAEDVRTVKLAPLAPRLEREKRLRAGAILPGYRDPEGRELPAGRELLQEGRSYRKAKQAANLEKLRQMTEGAYYGALGAPIPKVDMAEREQAQLTAKIQIQQIKATLTQMETDLRQQGQISKQQAMSYAMTLAGELFGFKAQKLVADGHWKAAEAQIAQNIYDQKIRTATDMRAAGWENQLGVRNENIGKRVEALNINAATAFDLTKQNKHTEAATSWGHFRATVMQDLKVLNPQQKAVYLKRIEMEAGVDVWEMFNIYKMKTLPGEEGMPGVTVLDLDEYGQPQESSSAKAKMKKRRIGQLDVDSESKMRVYLMSADAAMRQMTDLDTQSSKDEKEALAKFETAMPSGPSAGTKYDELLSTILDYLNPTRPGAEKRLAAQRESGREVGGQPGGATVSPPGRDASDAEKKGFVTQREGDDAFYDEVSKRVFHGTPEEMEQFRSSGVPVQEFVEPAEGDVRDDGPLSETWDEYTEKILGEQRAGPGSILQETREGLDELYKGLTRPDPTPEDQKVKEQIISSPEFQKRYTELYGTGDFDTERAFKHFMGQVRFAGRRQTRLERTKEREDVLLHPENYPKAKVAGAVITSKIVGGAEKLAGGVNVARRQAQSALSETPTEWSAVRLGGGEEWKPPMKGEMKQRSAIRDLIEKRRRKKKGQEDTESNP